MSEIIRSSKRRKIIIDNVSNCLEVNEIKKINDKLNLIMNNIKYNNELLKILLESKKEINEKLDNIENKLNKEETEMCEDMRNAYI